MYASCALEVHGYMLVLYPCGTVHYIHVGVRALRASVHVSQILYYAIAPPTDPIAQ